MAIDHGTIRAGGEVELMMRANFGEVMKKKAYGQVMPLSGPLRDMRSSTREARHGT